MNDDDFLQRVREPPRPEFLAELKRKLDRQPTIVPPRRASFTRGLITGLLLATAGFAIAAATLGVPDSVRAIVRAPVQFLARVLPGGTGPGEGKSKEHRVVVPLGPAWIPTHPASPSATNVETQKADYAPSSHVSVVAGSGGQATQSGANPSAAELNIVTSAVTYPLARIATTYLPRINVELQAEGIPLDRLCSANTRSAPEAFEVSRRLSNEVLRTCAHDRNVGVIEARIGYQAIVLARARLYGPMNLSARELFLALARRVPDPNNPDALIENPYYTWNQIDASLPYDPIKVFGPDPASFPGGLAVDLLLQAGCDSYPRFAALRARDFEAHTNFCTALRTDGVYITKNVVGSAFVDELTINPWILGVFSLPEFEGSKQQLAQITLAGVAASTANFASGAYPAARTLYVYANRSRLASAWLARSRLGNYVRLTLEPRNLSGKEGISWGFVPLDAADRQMTLDTVDTLKELQY
jgi:phosphate transport system substrate-binding protein